MTRPIVCAICGDHHGWLTLGVSVDSVINYLTHVPALDDTFHGTCLMRLLEAAGRLQGIDFSPLYHRVNIIDTPIKKPTGSRWYVGHVPLTYAWKEAK